MSASANGSTGGLPATADVVVIGAGAVGLCTSLALREAGRGVIVLDRAVPGTGASGRNAGVMSVAGVVPTATPGVIRSVPHMLLDPLSPLAIRWTYLPRLAPWLLRFVLASRPSRVESISSTLGTLVGPAMEAWERFLPDGPAALASGGGLLYAYRTEASFDRDALALELRRRRGIGLEILDDAGIGSLDPQLAGRFHRGILIPASRYTPDPAAFTAALAERLTAAGGTVARADVRDLVAEDGVTSEVRTSAGAIRATNVVVAAGAWSGPLARQVGAPVPLDTERGYGVELPRPGISLRTPILSGDYHFALTPALDGGLRLAGTDELAGIGAAPNFRRAEKLVAAAQTVFPELDAGGASQWIGFRPSMPDSLPVIGRAPRAPNVVLAFGHGHVGLTLAAITARLVAEILEGRPTSVDISPFRPERFRRLRGRG